MIASKIKIKNEARKTARSAYRASRSTVKSVRRSPTKKVSDGRAISGHSTAHSRGKRAPLSTDELDKIDAYWRAANYFSGGPILLFVNTLLKTTMSQRE